MTEVKSRMPVGHDWGWLQWWSDEPYVFRVSTRDTWRDGYFADAIYDKHEDDWKFDVGGVVFWPDMIEAMYGALQELRGSDG